MRWEALFDDVEAQLAAAQLRDAESRVSELSRLELSSVTLTDRLRGQLGNILTVRTANGTAFGGTLSQVGSGWMVLDSGPSSVLIPAPGIQSIEGIGRRSRAETSGVARRLGLAAALRALSRDRAEVIVHVTDGGHRLDGMIDRVGKDFLELAAFPRGEQRRSGNVSAVYALPFSAIAAVSSNQ